MNLTSASDRVGAVVIWLVLLCVQAFLVTDDGARVTSVPLMTLLFYDLCAAWSRTARPRRPGRRASALEPDPDPALDAAASRGAAPDRDARPTRPAWTVERVGTTALTALCALVGYAVTRVWDGDGAVWAVLGAWLAASVAWVVHCRRSHPRGA